MANTYIVKSKTIKKGADVTVDSTITSDSENPVQSKAIYTALNNMQETISDIPSYRVDWYDSNDHDTFIKCYSDGTFEGYWKYSDTVSISIQNANPTDYDEGPDTGIYSGIGTEDIRYPQGVNSIDIYYVNVTPLRYWAHIGNNLYLRDGGAWAAVRRINTDLENGPTMDVQFFYSEDIPNGPAGQVDFEYMVHIAGTWS